MPKILIGISILLMTLSLVFGFLNTNKVKGLRNEIATTTSAREMSDSPRPASEKKLKARETRLCRRAEQSDRGGSESDRSAEADLSKAQNEKAELEAKPQASEAQISELAEADGRRHRRRGAGGARRAFRLTK